jgi:hypothetical protein
VCYPVVVAWQAPAVPAAAPARTVKSPKGRTYTAIATTEGAEPVLPGAAVAVATVTSLDDFAGTDRRTAKTSISRAQVKAFNDLPSLVTPLKSDNEMRHHSPAITKSPDSTRVTEEDRNVTVNAFIYAVKFEGGPKGDHDFHVIIGNEPDAANRVLLNVEVTGLPPADAPDFARLQAVREKFKAHFAAMGVEIGTGFTKFPEGIPVRVTGSLFYDIDHLPGVVGPTGMQPKTAWEIHPVTDIEFEP